MGEEKEAAANTQLSSTVESEDNNTLNFLDSLDNYLILIETLSSTLRQGWMELASARYSMGASRVNSSLLNLKHHSAATTVQLDYDHAGFTAKSPEFTLCKWASSDSSPDKENIQQLKQDSENPENSLESSNRSETDASPRKTENPFQKERGKVLSMFGTLVSPKLRASQLSFEKALETLVEIANVRSSILEAHNALHKE